MTRVLAPIVRSNRLPALFNDNWLEDALSSFNKWDKAFDQENVHYPYDVSYVKDKEGNPEAYKLDIALAGISKDNIHLSVKEDHLVIEVDKQEKDKDNQLVWLRNNISHRAAKLVFTLGKDVAKDQIKSRYRDGLLSVDIPIRKAPVTDIEISVE